MKQELTEIAFVLDRSGSMQSMVEPAIAGFNAFLHDQQQASGEARLSLVLFDDEYEVPIDSLPVAEITELDATTYVPRGMTALLDAVGLTIDRLGERLAALPEPARPGQVVVAILTDGMENASNRYSLEQVASMIRHQESEYSWTFLFLGANQDAIASAARMGIAARDAATFDHDEKGYRHSSKSISRKLSALRAVKAGRATPEELADSGAAMSELLDDEVARDGGR